MQSGPSFHTASETAVQRKLDEQARLFRKQSEEARKELAVLLEKVSQLRRNPLMRPFANAALIDQVRKVKKVLSREITLPVREEGDVYGGERPKRFGFDGKELEGMTPEEAALVAGAVAGVVDHNLQVPYDPEVAAISAGFVSKDMFNYVGVEWLEFMIRHARLAPEHAVLDVGCGCGRMAGPLTLYLSERGRYVGFDPVAKSIAFTQTHLCQSNFRFEHVDLKHHLYNPEGTVDPSTFRFPCDDTSVDVSIAGSIFTHLDLKTAKHYLRETFRVLRPGGRALYSLFALDDDMVVPEGGVTRELGKGDGTGLFRFLNRGSGFYTHCDEAGRPKNHHMPDWVGDPVAFDGAAFAALALDAGLAVEQYLPGGWCDREYRNGYQDLFLLRRP
jgi:SAM-dependent methyltransferase